MGDEERYVIAPRIRPWHRDAIAADIIPGSEIRNCSGCDHEVPLTPGSIERIEAGATLLCGECGNGRLARAIEEGDPVILEPDALDNTDRAKIEARYQAHQRRN